MSEISRPQGVRFSQSPLIDLTLTNVIEEYFQNISSIEYALTPASRYQKFFENLAYKQLSISNDSSAQIPKTGGRFWVSVGGTPECSMGTAWAEAVEQRYRRVPFSINLTRDCYRIRKSFTVEELEFHQMGIQGGEKREQLLNKSLAPEMTKLFDAMHKQHIDKIYNQIIEGSPMFWDPSAGQGVSAHSEYPVFPALIDNQMARNFQTDLNKLGVNSEKLNCIWHPDQVTKALSTPLTKDLRFSGQKFKEEVYMHFGLDEKYSTRGAPEMTQYAGFNLAHYREMESFVPCVGTLSEANKPETMSFKIIGDPEEANNVAGAYWRIRIRNTSGRVVRLAAGDKLTYVGPNALCHVTRYGAKVPVPRARFTMGITCLEWMYEYGGYPGSLSEDEHGNPVSLREDKYAIDCYYEFAATGNNSERYVSIKNSYTYDAKNKNANTINRAIVKGASTEAAAVGDKFYPLADKSNLAMAGAYDTNMMGAEGSFFYFTPDMVDPQISPVIFNPKSQSARDGFDKGVLSMQKNGTVYLGNALKPQLWSSTSPIATGSVDKIDFGLKACSYVDTMGDQLNFMVPTKKVKSTFSENVSVSGFDASSFSNSIDKIVEGLGIVMARENAAIDRRFKLLELGKEKEDTKTKK